MIIAPAKNILFGEHAVVYPPNTAIIAANSLTCKAEAKFNNTSSIIKVQTSGEFSLVRTYDYALIRSYLYNVRKAYSEYKSSGDIAVIEQTISNNDDLLKLAIGVAGEYLVTQGLDIKGFDLFVLSEVPLQSGFGSSAVFSSAVIAAILDIFQIEFNKDLIFDLTMEIEGFQHLSPSGEGPAAVIYGDLIQLNKKIEGKPEIKKLKLQNTELAQYVGKLKVVYSGMPFQTTGELVNFVKTNISLKRDIINKIERNTQEFLRINKKKTCSEADFIQLVNNNGLLLEDLNIVSDCVLAFSKEIRRRGGAVKISGAGGQGEGGSGAVLVYHKEIELIKSVTRRFHFRFFDMEFGGEGIRVIKKRDD